MKTRRPPREDLALDPEAVLSLLAPHLGLDSADATCRAEVLQRKLKRLVVRYDIEGAPPVVGKWYSTERGAWVWDALRQLRAAGFDGPSEAVPAPIAYLPDVRALFVEAVGGPTLREVIRDEPTAASRAGAWLARFHVSPFESPRDCGPAKQADSVRRWSGDVPSIASLAVPLLKRLEAETSPGKPVHYDYYHAQVLCPAGGGAVVVDLDESGLGDPAFDVAHFLAHLKRLGVRDKGDPGAYETAGRAFLDGYAAVAPVPEVHAIHEAFAWFKLAAQAVARGQVELSSYAVQQVKRSAAATTG